MLDAFLEVLVEKEARHSAREEMADIFMALPKDELHKLASGAMKLADFDDHDWLTRFKGTPLYEPALQLEQQCLELDIQQQQSQQSRSQESQQDKAIWDAKDGIRLKKRMLDLELLKMESSTAAGGNIASGAPPAPDMQQEQAAAQPNPQGVAGAPMENVPKTASVKTSADTLQAIGAFGKHVDVTKAKGLKRVGQLLGGGRAKALKHGKELMEIGGRAAGTKVLGRVRGVPATMEDVVEHIGREHRGEAAKVWGARGLVGAGAGVGAAAGAHAALKKEPEKTSTASVLDDILKMAAESHTSNALARVRDHGTPAEKAKVFAAITKKHAAPKQKVAKAILQMRMQKLAAMSPLHAANYYGDLIADAARYGGVNGQVDPKTLDMMREHAMGDIGGHVADRQQAAEHAAAHPVLSRLKGGVAGGLTGGVLGAGLGSIGGKGGALIGGLAGLAGGGALGQHLTRPEAYANTAAQASEAHGALDPHIMRAALQREVAEQHMQRVQQHELEAAKSQGQYGQEARADAKRYSAELKHGAGKGYTGGYGGLDEYDEPYAKYGSAVKVADTWGRQMAQMEKDAIPFLGGLKGVANVFKTGLNKGVSSGAMKAGYTATNPGALAGLKNVGHYATNWASKNPTQAGAMLGAGVGAVGGAATAEKGHRLGGALKGGALGGAVGGAAGYAAPRISSSMGHGMSFGQAAQGAAKQGVSDVGAMGNRAMTAFKQSGTPLAAAAPA